MSHPDSEPDDDSSATDDRIEATLDVISEAVRVKEGTTFDEESLVDLKEKRKQWETGALEEYLEAYGEREETFESPSGIERKRLYTPEDISDFDYERELGFPGEPPFTRGVYPTMYRGRRWTTRQIAGFETAERTNERFKWLLEQGQTGLSTDFDEPTLIGYDSDHERAKSEVGRVGVAIDSLADLEDLFEGIPLDEISWSMQINSPAPVMIAFYVALADKRGVPREELRGTTQNEPFKEFIAQKMYGLTPRPSIKIVQDIMEFCAEEMPKWNWISLSGYQYRDSGGDAIHEVALTLAAGMAYVEAGLERGLEPEEFLPGMSFFYCTDIDLFEEVAKLRAARRIWSTVMAERYDIEDEDLRKMRFHIQTLGSSVTRNQPKVNLVRTTVEALAAILGGAQSLHVVGYDEAISIPSEDSQRLSLRTQQVLAEETGIDETIDPLGGSYYVEAQTREIEEQIYEFMADIEERGDGNMKEGMLAALEDGYIEKELADAAYEYQKKLSSGEAKKVAVNCYTDGNEEEDSGIELFTADEEAEAEQVEALQRVREERDEAEVQKRLDALREALEADENIMPYLVDAAKGYATEGEMMKVLRDKYGMYQDPGVF